MDRQVIRGKTLEGPLTDNRLADHELGENKVLLAWDSTSVEIVCEVVVVEHLSELRVEWSAVANEGTGLGSVTDELLLETLKTSRLSSPSDLIVFKRVNKPVSLVHLSLSSLSGVFKSLLFSIGSIEFSLKSSLCVVDLLKLCFGIS